MGDSSRLSVDARPHARALELNLLKYVAPGRVFPRADGHGDRLAQVDLRVERPSLEERFLEITQEGNGSNGGRGLTEHAYTALNGSTENGGVK